MFAQLTGGQSRNIGHADLVDTPDGATAMVMLGVRPVGFTRSFAPLGRETFITGVDWVDGWPLPRPVELVARDDSAAATFDFADGDVLDDPGWIAVRRMPADVGSLTDAPGRLIIAGDGSDLRDLRPRFVGRRQRHLTLTFIATVDARDGVGGLAARHDQDHWFALEASGDGATTTITARAALAGFESSWHCELPAGEVKLRMEFREPSTQTDAPDTGADRIRLIAVAGDEQVLLTELDGRYWSFETAKSFTGRVVGLYATTGSVSFTDFTYGGNDTPGRRPTASATQREPGVRFGVSATGPPAGRAPFVEVDGDNVG